jgi:hypothetical protein
MPRTPCCAPSLITFSCCWPFPTSGPPLIITPGVERIGNYARRLLDFKLQADDALHRQISKRADRLGIDDLPPKVWVNTIFQECADLPQVHQPRLDAALMRLTPIRVITLKSWRTPHSSQAAGEEREDVRAIHALIFAHQK